MRVEARWRQRGNAAYTYDGDGQRVAKAPAGQPTQPNKLYWYGLGPDPLDETDGAGNTNNSSFSEYVFFNGKRIAKRDSSSNVNYYFADHLGSSRVVTNATGTILDDSDFYPFGGERVIVTSSGNNYKFTGKERDTESNLDNFGARYYSSQYGRFMIPDWAAKPTAVPYANFGNPQSLNLYSYVQNNPTTLGDPDGHSCDKDGICSTPPVPPADPAQNQNQQANKPQEQRVGNIVDNETSGLRPVKSEGSGSAQDLHNAKVDIAHVVLNREEAGVKGGVASDKTTSKEQQTPQYRDAQAAAAEAARSSDTTGGSRNYVLDYGQRMPSWVNKMETSKSFGPFVNQAGGGDVPKDAQVVIRILIPKKPED